MLNELYMQLSDVKKLLKEILIKLKKLREQEE
jgi:hypothetical protein